MRGSVISCCSRVILMMILLLSWMIIAGIEGSQPQWGGICNDIDGDGYGDPASSSCTFPDEDCDDSNAGVNPGHWEHCFNGTDDDCDGQTDLADPGCACNDGDGDGYGDPATPACLYPQWDCDDEDPGVNPGTGFGPILPVEEFTETTFEGFDVIQYIPGEPVGLVFLFHGTNGSAQFARKLEVINVINPLIELGYGFVATESTQQENPKRWDISNLDPDSNPDLARLYRLYQHLLDTTGVSEGTPLFAFGMSNGAAFTSAFGHVSQKEGLPIRALAMYNGAVSRQVRNDGGLTVPTLFVIAENDTVVYNEIIRNQQEAMAAAGVTTEIHESRECGLSPYRFTRIPDISEAQSFVLFDLLAEAGIVDAYGLRILPLEEAVQAVPNLSLPPEFVLYLLELENQLGVVWAWHKVSSRWSDEHVAFFENGRE